MFGLAQQQEAYRDAAAVPNGIKNLAVTRVEFEQLVRHSKGKRRQPRRVMRPFLHVVLSNQVS